MVSYEEKVEQIRHAVLEALEPHEQVEPAAIIHGLTLVLAQAIVLLRGPDVKDTADGLFPVQTLLRELVEEWWQLGEEPDSLN